MRADRTVRAPGADVACRTRVGARGAGGACGPGRTRSTSTLADAGHPQRQLRIAHTFSLGLGFVPRCARRTARYSTPACGSAVGRARRPTSSPRCCGARPTSRSRRCRRPSGTSSSSPVVHRIASAGGAGRRPAGREVESVSLAQVRDRPFVAMELGSSSRTHMVNACARAGFVPRIAVEGNDLFVVESMVGAGIGVSVVPEGMTDHQHPRVVRLRIVDPEPTDRTVFLAYPRSANYESVHTLAKVARVQGGPARNRFINCNNRDPERCCSSHRPFIVFLFMPATALLRTSEFCTQIIETGRRPLPAAVDHAAKRSLFNVLGTTVGAAHSPAVDVMLAAAHGAGVTGSGPRSWQVRDPRRALGCVGHRNRRPLRRFRRHPPRHRDPPRSRHPCRARCPARRGNCRRGAVPARVRTRLRIAAAHRKRHLAEPLRPRLAHHVDVRCVRCRGGRGAGAGPRRRPPRGGAGGGVDDDVGPPRGIRFHDEAVPRGQGRRQRRAGRAARRSRIPPDSPIRSATMAC